MSKVYDVINSRIMELLEQGTVPWLKALKNDNTLLIHAAAQAQKAADYILNLKEEEPEESFAS